MLDRALATPWKAATELRRWLVLPLAWACFRVCGVPWGDGWRVYGLPLILRHRGSAIEIGSGLQMRNWLPANPVGINHRSIMATWAPGAVLKIGDRARMSGATICAATEVRLGDDVRLGANCTIVDTDFHPVDPVRRCSHPREGRAAPVVIGDNVFVGMNALILKGVVVGEGSVIGAGSVVTRDVPAYVVCAGNPARAVRALGRDDAERPGTVTALAHEASALRGPGRRG
jgi:acetyltransferase-like isoleucine patch superfamily enzyme